jgi:hypothetical protein
MIVDNHGGGSKAIFSCTTNNAAGKLEVRKIPAID